MQFSFAQLADLLQFPHGDDVVCEVPDTDGCRHCFQPFCREITGTVSHSFEGNIVSLIHNPTIHYFRQLLACTIFGRSNSNKVNEKEFFYLVTIFVLQKVNTISIMISHMQAIVTTKRGTIIFGGLITSIARVLGLEEKFSSLTPLMSRTIDIDMTRSMKLVKRWQDGKFNLMVANNVFPDFILPNPNRTDVRNQDNYCYIYDPVPIPIPGHIHGNVAAGGDIVDDYDQVEQVAPETNTHTPHMFLLKMFQVHRAGVGPEKEMRIYLPLLMTFMLK